MTTAAPEVIYANINADDGPTEIESMCPSCEENGTTCILLTKIPNYKEVIIMSFTCPHCGCRNNELQSGGQVDAQGLRLTLRVQNLADLSRQVIRSEYAAVHIPDVELSIAAKSQSGSISTIEGIITRARDGLLSDQPVRRALDVDAADMMDAYCARLDQLLTGDTPFTLEIDDCSGQSYVENLHPTKVDRELVTARYTRSLDDDKLLALVADDAYVASTLRSTSTGSTPTTAAADDDNDDGFNARAEVLSFKTPCFKCGTDSETNMKVVDIPHFKEIVLMSSVCEACGHRQTEAKAGGGICPKGCRFTLSIEKPEDLTRDVLKSDMCMVSLPDVEVEAGMAAINGRFTTVEGLLQAVKTQLNDECRMWLGDSAVGGDREKLDSIVSTIDDVAAGKRAMTLVLDDPSGNTYVQGLEEDTRLELVMYERSATQNDELGLTDMNTEHYQTASDCV